MSVLVMCRPERSLARRGADRRSVGAAQPEDRGEGMMMTRVRSSPPSAIVRRRAKALAAADPTATASERRRPVRGSSALTPSWWQERLRARRQAAIGQETNLNTS